MTLKKILLANLIVFTSQNLLAQELIFNYTSPNGVQEVCKILNKIPGGKYSDSDIEKEYEFCSINFYDSDLVACPKTWSTSPATMIRDLSKSSYTRESYLQSSYCGNPYKKKGEGVKNLAKFKTSMNQGSKSLGGGTSGTYSPSSLAYYHFSRYFDMRVKVPVSVYREMDRKYHADVIAPIGRAKSKGSKIRNGWKWLEITGQDPTKYSPYEEFVTEDFARYYGVLIKGPGERYGDEISGRRTRSWGLRQHQQMEDEVAPFIALKVDKPLLEAVEEGLRRSKRISSDMRRALGEVSTLQMTSWMKELSEIAVLDTIFGQQDRVGNIDYRWYWAYVNQKGKVKYKREKREEYEELSRASMAKSGITLPDKSWVEDILPGTSPELIQRTFLNDNDAAIRNYRGYKGVTVSTYASFPEKAGWLREMKHFSAELYKKIQDLDEDLQKQGPIYQWASQSLGMNPESLNQIVTNTHKVALSLKAQCPHIQFDLDKVGHFVKEKAPPEIVSVLCEEEL